MLEFVEKCTNQFMGDKILLNRFEFVREFHQPNMSNLLWAVGFRKAARLYLQKTVMKPIALSETSFYSEEPSSPW